MFDVFHLCLVDELPERRNLQRPLGGAKREDIKKQEFDHIDSLLPDSDFPETFILYPVNPVCVCTDTGQT